MMEWVFANLAQHSSTFSFSHLSMVEVNKSDNRVLFSVQSHIEKGVDSSDLNYPEQCREKRNAKSVAFSRKTVSCSE